MATKTDNAKAAQEAAAAEKKERASYLESVADKVNAAIARVAEVLPTAVRSNAELFVKRAILTFRRGDEYLQACTADSFIDCVVSGAEVGLPIDGKLAYAVPYKDGKLTELYRRPIYRAQFIPSYIGMATVAKRSGQITNCFADLVYEADGYDRGRNGSEVFLTHRPPKLGSERGEVIGGYGVVVFPDGTWNYSEMTLGELIVIQNRAKSQRGPWQTDTAEMRKKTLLRRSLKLYCSDPGFILATQLDDEDFDAIDVESSEAAEGPRKARRSSLNDHRGLPAPAEPSSFERDLAAQGDTSGIPPTSPREEVGMPVGGKKESAGGSERAVVEFGELESQIDLFYEAGNQTALRAFRDKHCGPDSKLPAELRDRLEAQCNAALERLNQREPGSDG